MCNYYYVVNIVKTIIIESMLSTQRDRHGLVTGAST